MGVLKREEVQITLGGSNPIIYDGFCKSQVVGNGISETSTVFITGWWQLKYFLSEIGEMIQVE